MRYIFAKYILVLALLPSVAFAGVFAILCAFECTALPWFTFIAGPVLALAFIVPFAVKTYRRTDTLSESQRNAVRALVLSSILWAPFLSFWVFGRLLSLLQELHA